MGLPSQNTSSMLFNSRAKNKHRIQAKSGTETAQLICEITSHIFPRKITSTIPRVVKSFAPEPGCWVVCCLFFQRRDWLCKLFWGGLIQWGLYWDMKEEEHNPGFSGKQVTSGEKALIHIGLCILYSPILALKVKVSVTLIFDFNFLVTLFQSLC